MVDTFNEVTTILIQAMVITVLTITVLTETNCIYAYKREVTQ